ncbi:hypothetical protein E4417_20955 [Stenotrophomonas maltophilia]|uniref:hypothetical protein n=1 Tax=Stenotrophomonas maltophilia TaxID=40324 RepID=UPI001094CBED|nr:hypothetical protein [Stenotrophomonas maltophilia]TGW15725.1 hypothetical protein E4417_20955 [Stenotrophomonas maltophilia]
MHGPAMFRSTSICLPLAALALSSLTAVAAQAASKRVVAPPSLVQAYRAAEASLRRIPGDDIESDFRPVWTGVADLDGDGRSEVVYFYTSTYTGGSFAQSNVVAVMTALTADDPRGKENPKGLSRVDAEDFAAIRESGYGDDAGIQIPGAVQSIRIDGNRIIVAFTVTAGATVCEIPRDFRHVCPPDGNYTWTLRWTPGTLARIRK